MHMYVKYEILTLYYMHIIGFLFLHAPCGFIGRARGASCMEMRGSVNGWTQGGMNGVQEAVDSGCWKWLLAGCRGLQ